MAEIKRRSFIGSLLATIVLPVPSKTIDGSWSQVNNIPTVFNPINHSENINTNYSSNFYSDFDGDVEYITSPRFGIIDSIKITRGTSDLT